MIYRFGDCSLDVDRQELRRGADLIPVEPKVLDLLQYLIRNRARVVSKDDLIKHVWRGRIVSESTLTSRITATRQAIGDSGQDQRMIRTIARKGLRFVGEVREEHLSEGVPPTAPARLPEQGESIASLDPKSGPERRQLTIMACDTGAAAHSARLDPEDLREVATACFDCVKEVVLPYGGFVAKSTTEGVLVYFGYPQAHEDDAERAVRAALAATRAVAKLKIISLSSMPLKARVGIATGLVVVGDAIDADEHRVVGETPHLATRLLALAEPDAVVVSGGTRRLIGGLFDYCDIGNKKSKGLAGLPDASRVLRESKIVNRFEALRSVRTELIGREEELELLLRRWGLAKTGEGRVVLVWGEPGIGKSRLAAALQDAIKAEQHSCLPFFCSPHRAQTALHPVISQLERAAGIEPSESDATKLTKLENLLVPSSRDTVALFAELLSISTRGRYAPLSLSPQRRKELVLERVIARIVALAAKQPLLVILEDAHWIDPTTRELFDIIIERVRGLPVLLIMTYRPEFVPPWVGQSHVSTLTLNRLGHRENVLMVSRLAGDKTLPPPILDQIVLRTDGVPRFIEEMTKSVLESLIRDESVASVAAADAFPVLAVPATLQASLVARLDRIAHARAVGQTGAALGREFSYAILKAVLKLQDSELTPLVDQLVGSELVHQRGAIPDSLYTFKHALVQDAVYETLLKSQRTELQQRIVEVLENEFSAMVERNPDVLAYHCTEAGLWEKAIEYRLRSARMALDRSAPVEAEFQVGKGASLLSKLTENATRRQFEGCLQVVVGSAAAMTKGFASPDVAAALSKAINFLDESAHPVESLHALCGLFNYHLIRSESPEGLKLAQPFLRRSLDQPTEMVINFLVGTANLHIGNFGASRAHLERARSLYEEKACRSVAFAGGYHVGSFTLIWLSLAYLYLGLLDQAAATISAAVMDARTRLHPFTLVSALLAQARFLSHTRDLERAIAATEEGNSIAVEQRSPYHVARAGILRAWNVVESGRVEEGIALMERALASQRDTGGNFQSSFNLSRLAEAHARFGNMPRAIDFAAQAMQEVEHTGERWWEAEAQRIRGEILLAASSANRKEAERCFQRALACARRQGAKFWELHAALSIARLWSQENRRAEAHDLLAQVYCTFDDGIDLPALKEVKALLDETS